MNSITHEQSLIEQTPRESLASVLPIENVLAEVSANFMRGNKNGLITPIYNYAETAQNIIFNQEGRSFEDSLISLLQDPENKISNRWGYAIGLAMINQAAALDTEVGFDKIEQFIQSITENPSLGISDSFVRMMSVKLLKEKAIFYIKRNNIDDAKVQVAQILAFANKNGKSPQNINDGNTDKPLGTFVYERLQGINEQRAAEAAKKESKTVESEEEVNQLINPEGERKALENITQVAESVQAMLNLIEAQANLSDSKFNEIFAVLLRTDTYFVYIPQLFMNVNEENKKRIYANVNKAGKMVLDEIYSKINKKVPQMV